MGAKGQPKTGGRKKGSLNKKTRLGGEDTLKRLVAVMEDPERMEQELSQLHGRDYFRTYNELLSYIRPKYSSVEFNAEVKVSNEVAQKLKNLMR